MKYENISTRLRIKINEEMDKEVFKCILEKQSSAKEICLSLTKSDHLYFFYSLKDGCKNLRILKLELSKNIIINDNDIVFFKNT